MAHNLFVAIAVSAPTDLPRLPGVAMALESMKEWASAQGYAERLIIDDLSGAPVTPDLVRPRLAKVLKKGPYQRIVVYFVGHGFYRRPDQIWILSDGPNRNIGRVSMSALRASLQTYHPDQISMISDACQEAAEGESGEALLLDDRPGPPRRTYIDTLQATLPGKPAFSFDKGPEERFCLFSKVLSEFLLGKDERAFQLADAQKLPFVTTQTLYCQFPDALEAEAAELRVQQTPAIDPGFPQTKDIYSIFPDRTAAPRDLSPPPAKAPRRPSLPNAPSAVSWLGSGPDALKDPSVQRDTLATIHAPAVLLETLSIVSDTGDLRLEPGAEDLKLLRPIAQNKPVPRNMALRYGEPHDGYVVLLPIIKGLRAMVRFSHRPSPGAQWGDTSGCEAINWADTRFAPDDEVLGTAVDAWPYLQALLAGELRTPDIPQIADRLRKFKHANPAFGVACAYLYDQVGDLPSIARLCHYYRQANQPVPFDIALLSRGKLSRSKGGGWRIDYPAAGLDEDKKKAEPYLGYLWQQTKAGSHDVAGVAPMLSAGWARMAQAQDPLFGELGELASSLTAAPVATLRGWEAENRIQGIMASLAEAGAMATA
jgi:hypothetical protein